MSIQEKVIQTRKPNGWPVRLVEYTSEEGTVWYAVEHWMDEGEGYGYWEDGSEIDTLEEAKARLDADCKELAEVPNWEAQARYDEEHGTINGYAPWQLEQEY